MVIAHRGASAYAPEHSILAVALAHGMGADFIEQDVVLSRDDIPVVLHDIYLDATTDVADKYPSRQRSNGRFYAIDFTLDELKQLRVHERVSDGTPVFPARFPLIDMDLRIPTLEEEIELIQGLNTSRQQQTGFYIELKGPAFHRREGKDIAEITLSVLSRHGLNEAGSPVYLQCFNGDTLRALKQEFKTPLPLIQLLADNSWGEDGDEDYEFLQTSDGLDRICRYAEGIGPWLPQLMSTDGMEVGDLVERAHMRNLLVHPYTLRADALSLSAQDFTALQHTVFINARVDGAFTDFPDLTRKFIDQHWQ